MQTQHPQLPTFNNGHYSGLAGLLSNPAYLAQAERVYLDGGEFDPKIATNLQSCAESTINAFGNIQAVFAKLSQANREATTNAVPHDEVAYAQFELSVMLGEVQPLLAYINNTLITSQS